MDKLVDNIIEVNFEELTSCSLPIDERYGLIVKLNNVEYKFLINIKSNFEKLMILGSGVLPETEVEKFSGRPLFKRQSWDLKKEMNFSTIFFDDPTRSTYPTLRGGWGVGSPDDWYLKNISEIFKKIFSIYNILNENVLFYSSSMGGFMSIELGTLLPRTMIWADIPQTDLKRYSLYKYIEKEIFNDNVDLDKYNDRIDCISLMQTQNYIPKIYLVMDISDYDLKNHFFPFIKRLYEYDENSLENNLRILINPIERHLFLKYEQFIKIKDKYFIDYNFEDIEFLSVLKDEEVDVKINKIGDKTSIINDIKKIICEEKEFLTSSP